MKIFFSFFLITNSVLGSVTVSCNQYLLTKVPITDPLKLTDFQQLWLHSSFAGKTALHTRYCGGHVLKPLEANFASRGFSFINYS